MFETFNLSDGWGRTDHGGEVGGDGAHAVLEVLVELHPVERQLHHLPRGVMGLVFSVEC